ncbi:Calcitonin gene-related peptide type 1 receptor, partial [Ophiophagus hannah]
MAGYAGMTLLQEKQSHKIVHLTLRILTFLVNKHSALFTGTKKQLKSVKKMDIGLYILRARDNGQISAFALLKTTRSLSCPRVNLHKNLFFSFICNCVITLTYLAGIVCKVLYISQIYFFVCNFFWMLCEGIYLYIVTVVNVFAKRQGLRWYYCFGWGKLFSFHFLFFLYCKNTHCSKIHCHHGKSDMLLNLGRDLFKGVTDNPRVNFLILIRIVHVIIKKSRRHLKKSIQYKKAMRATFILVSSLLKYVQFLIIAKKCH